MLELIRGKRLVFVGDSINRNQWEEDIIIMSTVRSNSHQSLEFISKSQRVNVSITRARHCLWILGNERTLSDSESVWNDLVLDAKSRRCFFNADEDKDLAKAILGYVQVLKIWDILPLEDTPKLINRLDSIFNRCTDNFINLCKEKCLDGDLEVPKSWSLSLEFSRIKDLSISEAQSDLVGDTSDCRSYVENSQVSKSLLLLKFYSLSSGVVNHLLSDREGRELELPFEVTDEEMEIILYRKSSFIVGRSGTGKTTVLTMKLFQKEQWHQFAVQGRYSSQNTSKVEQSSAATEGKVLRQLFVTLSPKLCFAIKRHVSHLNSFACGGGNSTGRGLIDMADFDEDETQFKDIQDSFHNIPPSSYPLVITFHKFLMMLDGTLSNSYFERFLDVKATVGHFKSSRSVAFQSFRFVLILHINCFRLILILMVHGLIYQELFVVLDMVPIN